MAGQDPGRLQFRYPLGTGAMVQAVTGCDFQVARSQARVGRLLGTKALYPQPPVDQAQQLDPYLLGRWRGGERVWPIMPTAGGRGRARGAPASLPDHRSSRAASRPATRPVSRQPPRKVPSRER